MTRFLGAFLLAVFRVMVKRLDAWACKRLGLVVAPAAPPCACPVCACYRQTLVEVSGARFVYVVWPTVPQ